MASAPLRVAEEGTLLSWFLSARPEAGTVHGRKEIERGLVHRLDTDTEGLVLVAKTQHSYDFFQELQRSGDLIKKYFAYCSVFEGKKIPGKDDLPLSIRSRFRAFGPGRKEVRPLFPGMRGYDDAGVDYETVVESVDSFGPDCLGATCSLARGFRHQVRAHLAWLGFPIIGDRLYNPAFRPDEAVASTESIANVPAFPLELHAIGIRFSDPVSLERLSFLLPKPDRTIR